MDPYQASKETEKICRLAPVIPVLVVHDSVIAKPLAEALISGGLPVLEVTLRTQSALNRVTLFFRPSRDKSDTLNPFLMVPRPTPHIF